ncbi:MAG TPA: LysM domain-containing protein, partial [Lacibacter sp.]|nr:LysM domain-containing protein [Lacibacter sp.]
TRREALLQLNQLTGKQMPGVGEKLYLPPPAPGAPRLSVTGNAPAAQQPPVTPSAGAEGDEIVIHLVQSKETLFSIARKYAVAVSDLRKWNGLSGDELREGIELIINKTPYVGHQGSR